MYSTNCKYWAVFCFVFSKMLRVKFVDFFAANFTHVAEKHKLAFAVVQRRALTNILRKNAAACLVLLYTLHK